MKEIKATNNPRIAIAGCVNSSVQTLKKLNEHSLNVVRVLSLNPNKSKNVSGYHDLTELGEKWSYPTTYFEKINDENIICYSCTEYRSIGNEYGVAYNDPSLKIKWPRQKVIITKKDRLAKNISTLVADKLI